MWWQGNKIGSELKCFQKRISNKQLDIKTTVACQRIGRKRAYELGQDDFDYKKKDREGSDTRKS